jgi:quercetin dioxygenase-like cupin family protein
MKVITALLILFCATSARGAEFDRVAEEYLVLELAMAKHDPDHVDAYFGPETYRQQAESSERSLAEIFGQAQKLRDVIAFGAPDGVEPARADSLDSRLQALQTRVRMRQGTLLPFDQESQLLFRAKAPGYDEAYFEAILKQIDTLVPGDGPLSQRVTAFRDQFIIPADRLPDVFETALNECRRRTLQHIELPAHENFSIEYVTDKPWGAYNWYRGNAHSLIQVNTGLPKYIEQAIHIGCHEGYPGHHTYNALLEQKLVLEEGWREFSLYALFSPQSLIAEGSANYGTELVFPGNERLDYEKETLFPLAGLDAEDIDRYYRLLDLRGKLDYAITVAARRYLNGEITSEEARNWLVEYRLDTPEKAKQRIRFFDTYRSYVINYNLGRDLVAAWVEAGTEDMAQRWDRFIRLLSSPMTAADLEPGADLPHAFEAGWRGEQTCTVLHEDEFNRIGHCEFPPGSGHERHYHNPHFGYTLAGSTLEVRDAGGLKTVSTKAGGTWVSSAVTVHEARNIGDTSTSYLIVEPKQD